MAREALMECVGLQWPAELAGSGSGGICAGSLLARGRGEADHRSPY